MISNGITSKTQKSKIQVKVNVKICTKLTQMSRLELLLPVIALPFLQGASLAAVRAPAATFVLMLLRFKFVFV